MAQASAPAIVAHASSLKFPGVTEPRPVAWSAGAGAPLVAHRLPSPQGVALFRPHPRTDSPALCPLHSTTAIRFAAYADRYRCVPAVTNWRDRPEHRARPGKVKQGGNASPASFRSASLAKLAGLADQANVSLTLRRHAPRGTAERAHASLASQCSHCALAAKSQPKPWRVLAQRAHDIAQGREASPGPARRQ